jgi:hypothetical protein
MLAILREENKEGRESSEKYFAASSPDESSPYSRPTSL